VRCLEEYNSKAGPLLAARKNSPFRPPHGACQLESASEAIPLAQLEAKNVRMRTPSGLGFRLGRPCSATVVVIHSVGNETHEKMALARFQSFLINRRKRLFDMELNGKEMEACSS
jgi:hypothetical protein